MGHLLVMVAGREQGWGRWDGRRAGRRSPGIVPGPQGLRPAGKSPGIGLPILSVLDLHSLVQ